MTNEEKYGYLSRHGFSTLEWNEQEFLDLLNDGFSEASITLAQLAQINDEEKALKFFKIGAEAGNAEAAWGAAAILGHGYEPDIEGEDKLWYHYCLQAAQGGCPDAMHELGKGYHHLGNYLAAYYWFQLAMWYEHPEAQYSVNGIISTYQKAGSPDVVSEIDGVPNGEVEHAKRFFGIVTGKTRMVPNFVEDAIGEGLNDGVIFLNLFMAHFMEEFFKNDEQAKTFYQLAAHNESIIGMKCLGDMLAYGKGCQQNMQNAVSWYIGAAEKGEKTACFIMGELYRKQNKDLAAFWYAKALRRGYEPARKRLLQL